MVSRSFAVLKIGSCADTKVNKVAVHAAREGFSRSQDRFMTVFGACVACVVGVIIGACGGAVGAVNGACGACGAGAGEKKALIRLQNDISWSFVCV